MGTIKRTFANSLTGTGKLTATNLDSNIPANNIADASVTNVSALSPSLGSAIPTVASDPPAPSLGDIWYNSSTGKLKNYGFAAAAWASGGNMNTGRQALSNASGTQTASMAVGGNAGPPYTPSSGYLNNSEEYDGSSWTSGNTLAERTGYSGNSGTQTASIISHNFRFSGSPPSVTPSTSYEYNGSTFTASNNIAGSGRYGVAAFGTQTAAVAACGSIVPANSVTESEEYDGTSWTTGNATINERQRTTGTGTQTAGLMTAGYDNGPAASYAPTATIELYDGTSWTAAPVTISVLAWQRASFGNQTNALIMGGNNASGRLFDTELYDGTTVSSDTSMTTRRSAGGGAGTVTSGLVAAGDSTPGPAFNTATEEYSGAAAAVKTVTTS